MLLFCVYISAMRSKGDISSAVLLSYRSPYNLSVNHIETTFHGVLYVIVTMPMVPLRSVSFESSDFISQILGQLAVQVANVVALSSTLESSGMPSPIRSMRHFQEIRCSCVEGKKDCRTNLTLWSTTLSRSSFSRYNNGIETKKKSDQASSMPQTNCCFVSLS